MQSALTTFLDRINTITRGIERAELSIDFGRGSCKGLSSEGRHLRNALRRDGIAGIQVTLDGSVLLLTAAFEQFVADLVEAFTDQVPSQVPAYLGLPDRIRSANESQTGEVLSRGGERFAETLKQELIRNLNDCNSGVVPYVLNGTAIAIIDRNLTSQELTEVLRRLAFTRPWEQFSRTSALQTWSRRGRKATLSLATNRLKELMEQRNQIAHRYGAAAPGPSDLLEHARFMRALGKAMVKALTDHLASL